MGLRLVYTYLDGKSELTFAWLIVFQTKGQSCATHIPGASKPLGHNKAQYHSQRLVLPKCLCTNAWANTPFLIWTTLNYDISHKNVRD